MFGFLSSKSLHSDVQGMVLAFAKACPAPTVTGPKSLPKNKVDESLEALYGQVAAYARHKRLGVIGRARLAKAFQEEMRQLNYPEELVSSLVNAVTVNALVSPDRR